MGNHLNRAAQVVPSSLFGDDRIVDLSGGEIILLRRLDVGVALVVA